MTEEQKYASPFDFKAEMKKIDAAAKLIADKKAKKVFIELETKELNEYNDMLRKMSKFVNAKNKNGQHPGGLR